MKKMFGIACLTFAVMQVQAVTMEESDGVAITFFPIESLTERLVAIELVTSVAHKERYKTLEAAVFKNDWRPLLFANQVNNPGKCTVIVLPDSYDVDCWLTHHDRADDTLRIKVKSANSVIDVVGHFSKKWLE